MWLVLTTTMMASAARSLDVEALTLAALRRAEAVPHRATKDDAERISWGLAAKRKGTGSRGVPHRLNADERRLFDLGKSKGFVEIAGSGWRAERREAPLVNSWRLYSDAVARPAIVLHKPSTVVLDLSPMRVDVDDLVAALLAEKSRGVYLCADSPAGEADEEGVLLREAAASPIHVQPRLDLVWTVDDLQNAKAHAQYLATLFRWPRTKSPSRKPEVKPGRSRRHGGYGIGR